MVTHFVFVALSGAKLMNRQQALSAGSYGTIAAFPLLHWSFDKLFGISDVVRIFQVISNICFVGAKLELLPTTGNLEQKSEKDKPMPL